MWTDGREYAWVMDLSKGSVHVKRTRGGADFEEFIPLPAFMARWWPTDTSVRPKGVSPKQTLPAKPFPREGSMWYDKNGGGKVTPYKVTRVEKHKNPMETLITIGDGGYSREHTYTLKDFWGRFSPCP